MDGDDRRCFLRVRRSRRSRDGDGGDGDDAPPETVAVPVTGDDGKARVMLFDLLRRRQEQQQQHQQPRSGSGGLPSRDEAVAAALERMTLGEKTAKRRQPLPRSEGQCRAVRTTRDGRAVFIDVSASLGERFRKDGDAAAKRDRADVAEDEGMAWAVYEARGNASALRGGPAPSIDDEGDRRGNAAKLRHQRLLEDFTQEIDPDTVAGGAWQVLDVPIDQPWTVIESEEDVQRLVFDPAEGSAAIDAYEPDEGGALGAYRRMRKFIAAQAVDGDGQRQRVLEAQSGPTVAAYAGDDLDSNAEDASGNEYPSTADDEVAHDSADDVDDFSTDGDNASDFDAPDAWQSRRIAAAQAGGIVIDEDDDAALAVADDDDDDAATENSDSWGVGTPKARRGQRGGAGRILGMDDDSDDDAGARRRRHDAFNARYDPEAFADDDVYASHGKGAAGGDAAGHEAYAPDDVYFDNEGNAYW